VFEKIVIIGGRKQEVVHSGQAFSSRLQNYYKETPPEERIKLVKDFSSGNGADVVFQCSNQPEAFVQGLEMMRRMGTLVEVWQCY